MFDIHQFQNFLPISSSSLFCLVSLLLTQIRYIYGEIFLSVSFLSFPCLACPELPFPASTCPTLPCPVLSSSFIIIIIFKERFSKQLRIASKWWSSWQVWTTTLGNILSITWKSWYVCYFVLLSVGFNV